MNPKNNNKTKTTLFFIITPAFFLRIYKLPSSISITGDFAWYLFSARDMLLKGKIPLVGIPSSVPIIRQGAFYTWILALALLFEKFNPLAASHLSILFGCLAAAAVYLVTKKLFSKKIALISSLLTTTSPFIIKIDKNPYFDGILFFLTLTSVWLFTETLKGQKSYFFLLGFFLGILFQFERASFILLPIFIFTLIFSKNSPKPINWIKLIGGGLVASIPLLAYDLNQGVYIQTLGFVIWVTQRLFEGLLGIFTKNQGTNLFSPFFTYMAELIYPDGYTFSLLLLVISFCLFIVKFALIKKDRNRTNLFVLTWLLIGVGSFFIRGIYSQGYMPFIYFPIIVILSSFFSWLIKKTPILGWLTLTLVVGSNIIHVLNAPGLEKVSLQEQIQVANLILQDANNKKFSTYYHGPADNFHTAGIQYQYLLWWKGNEPVYQAENKYIIWEGDAKKEAEETLLGSVANKVFIYKKK